MPARALDFVHGAVALLREGFPTLGAQVGSFARVDSPVLPNVVFQFEPLAANFARVGSEQVF